MHLLRFYSLWMDPNAPIVQVFVAYRHASSSKLLLLGTENLAGQRWVSAVCCRILAMSCGAARPLIGGRTPLIVLYLFFLMVTSVCAGCTGGTMGTLPDDDPMGVF